MLEGISKILTGDVLKLLCDMGHGDELVIADANFPAVSVAGEHPMIQLPGVNASELLRAIMPIFPVDWRYSEHPAMVMERTKEDARKLEPEPWREFRDALVSENIEHLERQAFYDRAKKAYCVIQTGEERQYGNLILVKGVVVD